jgi:hypothetical protein
MRGLLAVMAEVWFPPFPDYARRHDIGKAVKARLLPLAFLRDAMSQERDPSTDQPLPVKALDSVPVGESLKAMIDQRTALGIRKYGTPLMTNNGRNATQDALDEALDLCQYQHQIILELRQRIALLEAF